MFWRFKDFVPPEGVDPNIAVQVTAVVPDQRILFEWDAADGPYKTRVELDFEPLDRSSTLVRISESGRRETPGGLKGSYDNCHGWTQMSCCPKAYLEHGINPQQDFY